MIKTETHTAAVGENFLQFLGALIDAPVPADVATAVRQHTLEILAGAFSGIDIPEMQPVLRSSELQRSRNERDNVLVPVMSIRAEVSAAAGACAALSHAAEGDPIHLPTVTCPALLTIPTVLAIAQIQPVNGSTFMAAVCGGYEMSARLGAALGTPQLLALGWWPTAVCGSVAAAATAALALRLDARSLRDAVGLAAVHSGGLGIGGANTPAARNMLCAHTVTVGVRAALAAREGVPGPKELFSGERNFLTAFSRSPDTSQVDAHLGTRWAMLETSLKLWPCALQAQTALDALSQIVMTHGVLPAATEVEIRVPSAMVRIIDRSAPPPTRFAAAASVQFLAATMLLDGDISDARLNEPGRADERVLQLMKRVRVTVDRDLDARYPREWPARAIVKAAGRVLSADSSVAPGHPDRPLSLDESEKRFARAASTHLAPEQINAVTRLVRALDANTDMRDLVERIGI